MYSARKFTWLALVCCAVCSARSSAATLEDALRLEQSGDSAAARAALKQAVDASPNDPAPLAAWAGFLDRYHDPGTRDAYRKCLAAMTEASPQYAAAAHRVVVLDLIESGREAASQDAQRYHVTSFAVAEATTTSKGVVSYVEIPGPIRSFARMAAISSDAQPDEVLPALARNVVTNGYQASRSGDVLEQTEYMKLLLRYVSQAHELDLLAGKEHVLSIDHCDSSQTADLLRVIGFRMRGGCGSDVVLETVNAARAFITTDSGFPMADLEQALRTDQPFHYSYQPSRVPVLYTPDVWVSAKEKSNGNLLDSLLAEPSLCRFYLAVSKMDRRTADQLKASGALTRMRNYAQVLDFYGGMFEIKDGRALTPGGAQAAGAWAEIAGTSPDHGVQFFEKLVARDDGWAASYFDALARIHGPVADYLTDPGRIKRFYAAVRGQITSPGPARPVFRANADMMLLTTRLRIGGDGRPHIPGNIGVWRALVQNRQHGKYDSKLSRLAASWSSPDDVVEALFALSRRAVENEPLKIFMSMSDLDRDRKTPLEAGTVERLAVSWRQYGSQYYIFTESPAITDATILNALDAMQTTEHLRDPALRADTAGSLQAAIALWQIACRQGALNGGAVDQTLAAIVNPFEKVHSERELFDAQRKTILALTNAAGYPGADHVHEDMLNLMAGGSEQIDAETHDQIVKNLQHSLDSQHIISLTALLRFASGVDQFVNGKPADTSSMQKFAARVAEIQLPRPPLTANERSSFSSGYWNEKHIEFERRLNLRTEVERAAKDPAHAAEVLGLLAPLTRDTLVGYVYAHYSPPGAEIMLTNPLFVRAHDFVGSQGLEVTWRQTELVGTGWPSNGGGRLMGSLATLPYALAEAEQNFLVPTQRQALIWNDLAPQMILSATIPRWWNVTPAQMHWVSFHMRAGESLVAEAALNPALRPDVLAGLRVQVPPGRLGTVEQALERSDVRDALQHLTPIEIYELADGMRQSPVLANDPAAAALTSIASHDAAEVTPEAISRAFGSPKPTLANTYRPELLKLRTFPTLMGYSSRIMAESWESNTLYWVTIADEMQIQPTRLNVLIPDWTQRVIERIFASHLEDWPALLKSLRSVGQDVVSGTAAQNSQNEQGF